MSLWPPIIWSMPFLCGSSTHLVATGAGDSVLPRFDDGVSEAIYVIPGFRYFGSSYTKAWLVSVCIIVQL